MTSKFKEILDICGRRGIFKVALSKIGNIPEIILGPVGHLLQENLKTEWMFSNITNRDISVFLNKNDSTLQDSYNFIKEICEYRVPFGIANIQENSDKANNQIENSCEIDVYFQNSKQTKLQSYIFVSPVNSIHYFHNWQRQRFIWWRKFSASPGRYFLTDIQISQNGDQNVEIISKFPWGSHVIEQIFLNPNGDDSFTNEQLQVKDGRKKVTSHCVTSTTYLNTMVLNTLCDAFDDETFFQETKRSFLRLHRKIAPYKISFAVSSGTSNTEEINELASFLCRKLRANHISVLFLPNTHRSSLEIQWSQYDQLGIPYCLILNDNTLKNGIALLRNRDTSLKEQVHVSDLTDYVEKLFKNY